MPGAVSGRQEVRTFQDGKEHFRMARNMPGEEGIYREGNEYARRTRNIPDDKDDIITVRNIPG